MEATTSEATATHAARLAAASYLRSRPAYVDRVTLMSLWHVLESKGIATSERIKRDTVNRWHLAQVPEWVHQGRAFVRVKPTAAPVPIDGPSLRSRLLSVGNLLITA